MSSLWTLIRLSCFSCCQPRGVIARCFPCYCRLAGFLTSRVSSQGRNKLRFQIDTGLIDFGTGTLKAEQVASLVTAPKLQRINSSRTMNLSGDSISIDYQGKFFALGGFGVEKP